MYEVKTNSTQDVLKQRVAVLATHSQLSEEELADQGIKPNTICLSIGTEHIDEYADAYNALLDGRGDAFSTDNTEVLAFFYADYEATLADVYGDAANPDNLVVEGGKVD